MNLKASLNVRLASNISDNGRLIDIFSSYGEIRSVLGRFGRVREHILTEGKVIGNHYHEKTYEIIYVSGGRVIVCLKERATGKTYSEEIYPGRKFNLVPGIAHAVVNQNKKTAHLIEIANIESFYESPNNPHKDVYEIRII